MRKKHISVTLTILTFALTFVLLANEKVLAGPAQIVVVNVNAPGVGFNDPTPAAPVGGNNGTTLGEQRLIAFQHAANIWSARLNSDVPIRIRAQFTSLAPNVLGSAGAGGFARNFPNAPLPDTWYHIALANSLAGFDLSPTGDDISTNFSTNFNFYLGIDSNHGAQQDLVAVLLHEFAHGLGFSQTASLTNGALLGAGSPVVRSPDAYNTKLLDISTGKYWGQMTNAERVASATNSGKVVFDGAFVNAGVPNVISFGVPSLRVNSPAAITGNYAVGTASFGSPLTSSPISGDLVQALDAADAAGPTTFDGCSSIANAVAGKIAVIDRGTCGFTIKVKNAQDAGAIAVIIADNAAGSPPAGMSGVDATIVIPSVRVTQQDGNAIKAQLANGVNVAFSIDLSIRAGADALGRMRVNAPNPIASGSSISHFDPIAFRNLLMEPAINADLTHKVKAPNDLTFELLRDLGWRFPDADGDEVVDDEDCNPNSDRRPTVIVNGRDTGVPNILTKNGCTISDLIAQIAGSSRRDNIAFVNGVAQLTSDLLAQGIINNAERDAIMNVVTRTRK
jgi:PA domain